MSKELWFQEFERILNEKEAAIDEAPLTAATKLILKRKAYDAASDEASDAVAERLADMADYERKRRREEGR